MSDARLLLESEESMGDGATFVANQAGGIYLSVAEEQAIDSYNAMVTSQIFLTGSQARELLAWLKEWFP